MPRQRFPNFLKQHRIVWEAYQGWNTFAAPEIRRGLIEDIPVTRATKAGLIFRVQTRLYLPPERPCAVGSRVALPDGRKGFATASARVGDTTLSTPHHFEVLVDITTAISSPFGETVVILRKVRIGIDDMGNDDYTVEAVEVPGCTVRFGGPSGEDASGTPLGAGGRSVETNAPGSRVITTGTVIMPPGSVVKAIDRLRIRGQLFDIVGTPDVLDDEMTSPGVGAIEVHVQRVSG